MSRLEEALDLFRENFKPSKKIKAVDSSNLSGLSDGWLDFYKNFGVCKRKDGFIWIIDPNDHKWVGEIFNIHIIPVARNSFGDFICSDNKGKLYSFLPEYRQIDELSQNIILSIITLSEKEFTDDKTLIRRHKIEVKSGNSTDYDTCYCLKPIIPLGGSESDSEIYVGDIKTYLELIAQATS